MQQKPTRPSGTPPRMGHIHPSRNLGTRTTTSATGRYHPNSNRTPLRPPPQTQTPPPPMPEAYTQNAQQPTRQPQPATAPPPLRILQINLNKSKTAHHELINNIQSKKWDIVLIQEPYIVNHFGAIPTATNYRPVYQED